MARPMPQGWQALAGGPHLPYGVPTDADPSDDVLLDHGVFVVSYNPRLRDPNWVAWRLTPADLGAVHRGQSFHPDPLLPVTYLHVLPADYSGSGYDRGHLCPSGDRTASSDTNDETFVMTNVQPQRHASNAGPWEKLERFERRLAGEGRPVFIVAGGVFGPEPRTIGQGVAVPAASWKVLAVPCDAPCPVVRAYAAVIPNDDGVAGTAWTDYLTSVDEVEAETGYDLFSALPLDVQRAIEEEKTTE
jgi:endonuclease G